MIEIKHRKTGKVLHCVDADTLERAKLNETKLANASLAGAYLSGADLWLADLYSADLSGANIGNARLNEAKLVWANLVAANLSGSRLAGADFRYSDLSDADLTFADLVDTNMTGTILNGTDMTGACLDHTFFGNCTSLHLAKNLDQVDHTGPSCLDHLTLRACIHGLPDVFLQGVGYNHTEIETLRILYTDKAIRFYSCFLSHAECDGAFADRLRTDLDANDVSNWHYRYDLQGGIPWRPQINEQIKKHDKLVLICSEESVKRPNVVSEILSAIKDEQNTGTRKLFPILLDDFILSDAALELADGMVAEGKWREDWVTYVRSIHMLDFRNWKDRDHYQSELNKLLRDLKEPEKRG